MALDRSYFDQVEKECRFIWQNVLFKKKMSKPYYLLVTLPITTPYSAADPEKYLISKFKGSSLCLFDQFSYKCMKVSSSKRYLFMTGKEMLIIRIDDNTIDFLNIVELLKTEIETINNFYSKCMSKIKCCGQNISSNFF